MQPEGSTWLSWSVWHKRLRHHTRDASQESITQAAPPAELCIHSCYLPAQSHRTQQSAADDWFSTPWKHITRHSSSLASTGSNLAACCTAKPQHDKATVPPRIQALYLHAIASPTVRHTSVHTHLVLPRSHPACHPHPHGCHHHHGLCHPRDRHPSHPCYPHAHRPY